MKMKQGNVCCQVKKKSFRDQRLEKARVPRKRHQLDHQWPKALQQGRNEEPPAPAVLSPGPWGSLRLGLRLSREGE